MSTVLDEPALFLDEHSQRFGKRHLPYTFAAHLNLGEDRFEVILADLLHNKCGELRFLEAHVTL